MPVTSATFVRTTIVLLLVGLLTLVAIVASSLWLVVQSNRYTDRVFELQQVRRATFRVVDLVQDAETGQRGYLLTGEEPYLEPFAAASGSLENDLATLSKVATTRPEYGDVSGQLERLVRDKLRELSQTVDLTRAGRRDEAMAVVRSDRGKQLMDQIRTTSEGLLASVDTRLSANSGELRANGRTLAWVLGVGGVLIVLVVGGSTWVAYTYTRDLERARAEVAGLNADLESRVRERTVDLARANEEIQRFAYIVSHDLRSPLVNIMGFTSELETGLASISHYFAAAAIEDSPKGREAKLAVEAEMPEAVGFIRSSTGKMDNLINAILKLSREGGRKLSRQHVDMGALLTTAAETVQHRLSERGGEITVATPIPNIVSDRLAVEQIFGNLVDNAVKYLDPRRPGRIFVRGRDAAGQVIVEVEDNGRGIATEDRERIFELFRRAGVQDTPGEGIGLSHVRALVRRLGGDIEVESTLGRGTTFRVRLPKQMPLLRETA